MLINTQINGDNIQIDFKEDNKLWGISFIKKEDNSEYLAQIKEHATDEEYASIVNQIPTIEATNV